MYDCQFFTPVGGITSSALFINDVPIPFHLYVSKQTTLEKKVSDFPVSGRDVTSQTLPGRE